MGTREIASKTIGNFNIDNDQVYIVDKNNFGWTSDDDVISTATVNETGGIQLYSSIEARAGVVSENAQKYALQIESEARPKAFVHVPWVNSQYLVKQLDDFEDTNGLDLRLCVEQGDIYKVGDQMMSSLGWLYIDHIDVKKIKSRNNIDGYDMTMISTTQELCDFISAPLKTDIETLRDAFNKEMQQHVISNATDFRNVSSEIESLCSRLDRKIDDVEYYLSDNISTLGVNVYNRINTLCSNQDIAPSYFKDKTYRKDEVDVLTADLSNTVHDNFMPRYAAYLCSETYSQQEVDDLLKQKQNLLNICNKLKLEFSADIDIPTVKATMDYVNSSLQTETATFRGSYDSVDDVPTDGSKYPGGKPDNNDYMYVDITDNMQHPWRDSLKTLERGTWRFKYICQNHSKDQHSCWDKTGIGGWYEEYLINDTLFTDAQRKAINSGITASLVNLIMSYETIKAKLKGEFPNLTAKLGQLAYTDEIQNVIRGKGNVGKLAVFDGTNTIKSDDNITPKLETWEFTLVDGSKITKKVVVSE